MKAKKTTTERFLAHKKRVEETFQRTKRTTSLYFLLWAIFTVFTLLILIVGTFSQQFVLSNALKEQASREMAENGPTIVSLLKRARPSGREKITVDTFVFSLAITTLISIS